MASKPKGGKPQLAVGGALEFHYQKTPQYRVYHSDGCVGGPTPRGQIALSFYSERPPIPKMGKRAILAVDGKQATAGPEEVAETLSGLVRQVEATIMMDLRSAQEFHQFFGEQVAKLETALGISEDDRVTKATS
jgi:hypothetical protein